MLVREKLDGLGLTYGIIELGEVEIKEEITIAQRNLLKVALLIAGLELIEDKRVMLIEKIKSAIVTMVHYSEDLPKIKNSEYLSEKLHYDYTYLSNVFSESKGTTIEHYIIAHKIERVKELLLYNELNLTQISYKLNYSSVAHLSKQFKKVTGLTPSYFKQLKNRKRLMLEAV